MKSQLNETKRMQQLAGVIKEDAFAGRYKTGPEGLILSKLASLEKVLSDLLKVKPDIEGVRVINLVLKTFDEIHQIADYKNKK
jgi:hypothetical protein